MIESSAANDAKQSAPDLYTLALLAHAKEPRHQGLPKLPRQQAAVANRLCGDAITVGLRLDGDAIVAFGFEASACALTVASASLLGEALYGASAADARRLAQDFADWLGAAASSDHLALERLTGHGLTAFEQLRSMPSRRRCALLPFEALLQVLDAAEDAEAATDQASATF